MAIGTVLDSWREAGTRLTRGSGNGYRYRPRLVEGSWNSSHSWVWQWLSVPSSTRGGKLELVSLVGLAMAIGTVLDSWREAGTRLTRGSGNGYRYRPRLVEGSWNS